MFQEEKEAAVIYQFKIHELTSLLEEKDSLIKRQSEVTENGSGGEEPYNSTMWDKYFPQTREKTYFKT